MNTRTSIKRLMASYPQVTVSAETIAAYLMILQHIPDSELNTAISQAIVESPRFLPPPGEILRVWRDLTSPAMETHGEAWGNVQRAMRGPNYFGVPKFKNPLTAKTVQLLGWRNICESDNPDTIRAQFRDIYNGLAARQQQEARLLPEARQLAAQHGAIVQLTAGVAGALTTNRSGHD